MRPWASAPGSSPENDVCVTNVNSVLFLDMEPTEGNKGSAKLSAFSGANLTILYDCSRQWTIELGAGVSLEPATLSGGTEGQILIAASPTGVKPIADPANHRLTLNPMAGSPNSWHVCVAPEIDLCQVDDRHFLAIGHDAGTNVVGLISSNPAKSLIGLLVSPAPPEPTTIMTPGGGTPIPRCPGTTTE